MILKVYEMSLDPDKLPEFLEVWGSESSQQVINAEHFALHLNKATEVLSRLATAETQNAPPKSTGPGLEAFVNWQGEFIHKSGAWQRDHADCPTLYDALPEIHRGSINDALFRLRASEDTQSQLIICQDDPSGSSSMILLQTVQASPDHQGRNVHVRWLRSVWSERLHSFFDVQYRLTDAELSVFELIVAGVSFAAISARLGKSSETIKTQSKAIYSKLGVSGREAALRLALQIQLLLPNNLDEAVSQIQSLQTETIIVQGRKIGITRKGQLSGQPFMLLHGIVSGYEFGPRFEEQLRRANLCAICVERPGYGRSGDPASPRTIMEEWLDLFPHLLKVLGLPSCTLVTHASGGGYVAETLVRHPDLAPRGICISTGMPNFSGVNDDRFPPSYRFLYWCLNNSSNAFASVFKIRTAYLNRRQNHEKLIRANHSRSAADREALSNPANMQCAIAGHKLSERPKGLGFIGDITNLWTAMDRWKKLAVAPDVGSHLHHIWGAQDPMISVEASKQYCDSLHSASWSIVQDGGHLLQYSHADALVARIKLMVQNDARWNSA